MLQLGMCLTVWPDWAIYWTLDNFLKYVHLTGRGSKFNWTGWCDDGSPQLNSDILRSRESNLRTLITSICLTREAEILFREDFEFVEFRFDHKSSSGWKKTFWRPYYTARQADEILWLELLEKKISCSIFVEKSWWRVCACHVGTRDHCKLGQAFNTLSPHFWCVCQQRGFLRHYTNDSTLTL